MKKGIRIVKQLYSESLFFAVFDYIFKNFFTELKEKFFNSFTFRLWKWFDRVVLNSKAVKILFDLDYIAFVWKNSFFYNSLFIKIKSFSYFNKIKRFFNFPYVGIFLVLLIILPDKLMPQIFISKLFYALFIGILLFFVVSNIINGINDVKKLLFYLYISAVILCTAAIVQIITGSKVNALYSDGVRLGELLIIIFPFLFVYSIEFNKGFRKYPYFSFIFIAFINIIPATRSKAAVVGFLTEMLILIITDIKYFPLLLLLAPLGLGSFIENIKNTWHAAANYGNFITNIIIIFNKVWNFGFGISRIRFMDIYKSNDMGAGGILTDAGAILMIFFLVYILRLARSSLTSLLGADKKYKRLFAAGLAFLAGISVSSFFETAIFSSRTMLIYWSMLGILRAVRIMNFKDTSLDKTVVL